MIKCFNQSDIDTLLSANFPFLELRSVALLSSAAGVQKILAILFVWFSITLLAVLFGFISAEAGGEKSES